MHEWWHGTPTGDLGPSTPHAIHVGTLRAATQALEARIGIPVTGKWDGTRTYGETKLAGQRTLRGRDEFLLTGHNCCDAPEEDYYPRERADRPIYAGNQHVRDEFCPNIFPVQIVGRMSNTPSTPMSDTRANATMAGQLKRGTAKRGYYYINDGEDAGSVSAVVPGPSHLVRENPVSSAADYPDFEAALQAASSRFGATHVVRQGNRSAIIYSPTSRGYERRSLSCDRGFFHWPKQADLVDEVPENAERVVDVLDIGFDPDAPPRREAAPVRRAAEEARGSDRERWEKLQSEFRRLTDEMTKVESEAHVKFGPHGLRYASRALQTKHEKLVASRNRVYEKIFAMTQKLSPRDWGTGVPTWWVAGKLTFDDLVRPIGEPLSVTPPLAYGATRPMQEGAREMGAVREEVWRGRRRSRYEDSPAAQRERETEKNKSALAEFLQGYDIELLRKRDKNDVEWIYTRPEGELTSVRSYRVGSHPYHGDLYESVVSSSDGTLYLQQPGAMGFVYSKLTPKAGASMEASEARRGERVTTPHGDRFEVVEYTLPIYWASYLINGDASGLEDGEQEEIDAWLEREGNPYFVDVSDDSHFAGRNDATNLGGDVATYTAHMRPGGTAPDSGGGVPRMQSGYAFYTPSKRKGDWKKIPNDDWEHVVVGEDEIGKSSFVGIRDIDGSMHDIFEVHFAQGPRSKTTGYYAQLQTHTRGRGAAHEFASGPQTAMAREFASGPQTAMDFASPKDAISHAQRSWGATHVDFHGTRNRPTVYGTKAGARWKKTLFKEKGKFHWPDKFAKGPKRLSGAIELTPVAMPTHTPAPVTPGVPDDDHDRHLPGQADEAREADRRYTTRQSPKDASRDDVSFEGQWVGYVRGPFSGARTEDFFEWVTSRHSGRASTRRAALNALIRMHKAQIDFARRGAARENPATDLQDAIPWVRVTRDPERYKEALARAQKIGPVDDARKVYELVGPALMKEDQETFIVVLIDVRQNCRGVAEIHRGARSRVATSVLDVMRIVVAAGAEGFIVCHNHPSGKAMPSDADRDLTKAIQRAAKPFAGETAFLDHVVIGAGEYFSFADNKLHRAKN